MQLAGLPEPSRDTRLINRINWLMALHKTDIIDPELYSVNADTHTHTSTLCQWLIHRGGAQGARPPLWRRWKIS